MKNIIIAIFLGVTLQAYAIKATTTQHAKSTQRVALVIGNSSYTSLKELKSALNDARLMRDTLKKRDFKVIYKENASKIDLKQLLKKFAHKITKGGIGIFYFAGHSVNVDGKIYLVGKDSTLDNKDYIEHETILLNNIIKKMRNADNRHNIILLDTCRNTIVSKSYNNPFSRGVSGGLLSLSNTRGIFLAYTTADGKTARTGGGSHGILTSYFVQNIKKEGITIKEAFENTKRDVHEHTNYKGDSTIYNKIKGNIFFIIPNAK